MKRKPAGMRTPSASGYITRVDFSRLWSNILIPFICRFFKEYRATSTNTAEMGLTTIAKSAGAAWKALPEAEKQVVALLPVL